MMKYCECIDLRQHGSMPRHTYAYYRLRDLLPGEVWELLSDEEPELIMESVNFQLRHALVWDLLEAGPPLWRLRLRRREDTEAVSLVDVLEREHLRLDKLFAEAMHCAAIGDRQQAGGTFQLFSMGLTRHVYAENNLLAPSFEAPRNAAGDDPTSIMLREHEEILGQVSMIEDAFAQDAGAGDLEPLLALLSGQMAKHEAREELNLFPHWRAALQRAPAGSETQLVRRLKAVLNGQDVATGGSTEVG